MKKALLLVSIVCCVQAYAQNKRVEVRSTDEFERRSILLEQRILDLEAEVEQLRAGHDSLQRLFRRKAVVSLDLGTSIQQFRSIPIVYYADREGAIHSIRYGSKPQPALNLLLSYTLKNNHLLLLNFPLLSMSMSSEPGVGLFNKSFAMGMGYGFRKGDHKLFAAINVQPFEQPDLDVLQQRYRYIEPYTALDLSELPAYRRYNPGFSLGYAYQIWTR